MAKKFSGSQRKAIEAFKKYRTEDVEYCAFAGALDGGLTYELWYREDGEYCVSYIVLFANNSDYYYEGIQELILDINTAKQLEKDRLSISRDRRIRLVVGSFAFLAALAIVLYRAGFDQTSKTSAILATICVVASGCVSILGVWVPNPFKGTGSDARGSAKRKVAQTAGNGDQTSVI